MVISHKYKYLFVELPRTGTVSISKELKDFYSGQDIYQKHTRYSVFKKNATENEKEYFVFSCIRNPIDRTVSLFFHLDKTIESLNRRLQQEKPSFIKYLLLLFSKYYFQRRYNFIINNAVFSTYFLKFHHWPYIDWSILSHDKFDYIIKFEKLNEDFKTFLNLLGIKPKRDLPLLNKTKNRDKDYLKYFNEKAIKRAKRVYGIYMQKLGYSLPDEWGQYKVLPVDKLKFNIKLFFLKILWRFYSFSDKI